jgi:hypothetical protein
MEKYELRINYYQLCAAKFLSVLCLFCGLVFSIQAQSTSQSFPTPITASEINGKIAARDLGDARLTNYFYVFNGNQGDIFINVKTSNFDGDIDIFIHENLRPLTKITVFSDVSENETGRVIYLRKPEKLILRIQGRTPNDNAATFSLKFAGSFAPAQVVAENDAPELPKVKTENQSDVQVNSVGTIISVKPKPTPRSKETAAKNETKNDETSTIEVETKENKPVENETNTKITAGNTKTKTPDVAEKPVVVVTRTVAENNAAGRKVAEKASPVKRKVRPARIKTPVKSVVRETKKPVEPNPLENIQLIILFKDGTRIERPMSEVLRVGVDKGVLTLITKDGAIARYRILDVAKMTIE